MILSPLDLATKDIEPELDTQEELETYDEDLSLETLWEIAYSRDTFAPSVLEALRKGQRRHAHVQLPDCEERRGRLYVNRKQYVPNSTRLRAKLCQALHDSMATGHPGRTKMITLIYRNY